MLCVLCCVCVCVCVHVCVCCVYVCCVYMCVGVVYFVYMCVCTCVCVHVCCVCTCECMCVCTCVLCVYMCVCVCGHLACRLIIRLLELTLNTFIYFPIALNNYFFPLFIQLPLCYKGKDSFASARPVHKLHKRRSTQ